MMSFALYFIVVVSENKFLYILFSRLFRSFIRYV